MKLHLSLYRETLRHSESKERRSDASAPRRSHGVYILVILGIIREHRIRRYLSSIVAGWGFLEYETTDTSTEGNPAVLIKMSV